LAPAGLHPRGQSVTGGIPRTRIERLANETTNITADTALRLAKALNTTPQLWLNLQNAYDVRMAELEIGKELARIESVVPKESAAA
jgi:addiction module HigA family antidote